MINSRSILVFIFFFALIGVATNIQAGWIFLIASVLLCTLFYNWVAAVLAVSRIKSVALLTSFAEEGSNVLASATAKGKCRFSMPALSAVIVDSSKNEALYHPLSRMSIHKRVLYSIRLRRKDKDAPVSVPLHFDDTNKDHATFNLKAPRRGIYRRVSVAVISIGPFGISVVYRLFSTFGEFTVCPGIYDSGLPPQTESDGKEVVVGDSRKPSRSGVFLGLRDYQPGDPMRSIHWKTAARRHELATIERSEPPGDEYTLLIDDVFSKPKKEFELLLKAAASTVSGLSDFELPFRLKALSGPFLDCPPLGKTEALRLLAGLSVKSSPYSHKRIQPAGTIILFSSSDIRKMSELASGLNMNIDILVHAGLKPGTESEIYKKALSEKSAKVVLFVKSREDIETLFKPRADSDSN